MKLKQLMLAPVALGMVAPVAANAADLNMAAVNQYTSAEQVTSVTQFSDVQPTDWAYQALSQLVERYGCVAGYPNGTFRGGRAMTRWEAAALLNACLDRVTEVTDELKRLANEFAAELAVLKGREDVWKHKLLLLKHNSSPPLPNSVVKQTLYSVVLMIIKPKLVTLLALHSTMICV